MRYLEKMEGRKYSIPCILVIVMLVAFLVPTGGDAQSNTGSLTGYVFHEDGKSPLSDARIVLIYFENGKETDREYESNLTDATGEYKLDSIPEGKYKGKILVNGKRHKIKRVDFYVHIFAGETNFLSFALKGKK